MIRTAEQMHDYLVDTVGVSEETVQVVTKINGYSEETMQDILYVVTGYKYFSDYIEQEEENYA